VEALFAQEARLDCYTLARIEIKRNIPLTAPQNRQH
jgi:lipase chaperone LimK